MGARDNVLFQATVASGTAAGTVVPLSLLYGIENVRQGYGAAKLKGIYGFTHGGGSNYNSDSIGVPVEIKNSNWIDAAGLIAQRFNVLTACNKNSLNFMRGRDKALQPNTSWTIAATLPYATNGQLDIYVLVEIEYADVPGVDAEKLAGSPVMKKCANSSVTIAQNAIGNLGTFDNLLQGVTYVLSEASFIKSASADAMCGFLIIEGFSNQRGLSRLIPVRNGGLAEQIEGSVYLTKQTYNIGYIPVVALSSAAVTAYLEMIASTN